MNKTFLVGLLIVILVPPFFMFQIPQTPEKEINWCIKNQPRFNSSTIEGLQTPRAIKLGQIQQKCFNEYWKEYCKYSYPEYCPK